MKASTDQKNFDKHKAPLLFASMFLIIGVLLPTTIGNKYVWFWDNISLTEPDNLIYKFVGLVLVVTPFILCKILPTRILSIMILLFMVIQTILAQVILSHSFQYLLIEHGMQALKAAYFGPVALLAFIVMGVGSRLMLVLPGYNYPAIIVRIASFCLLLIVAVLLFQKNGHEFAFTVFFNLDAWLKAPLILLYMLAYPALFIIALLSTFKKLSSEIILTIIIGLVVATTVLFIYILFGTSANFGFAQFVLFLKIIILGVSSVVLFSASLYSSCYLFSCHRKVL